jgi:hypothetical protein
MCLPIGIGLSMKIIFLCIAVVVILCIVPYANDEGNRLCEKLCPAGYFCGSEMVCHNGISKILMGTLSIVNQVFYNV